MIFILLCRVGETNGSFCMLTSIKDGRLENHVHKVDIGGLVEEHQRRNKSHIDIVTTHTTKPQPQYHMSLPFDQPAVATQGNHNDDKIYKNQQNFVQNGQHDYQNGQHYARYNPYPSYEHKHKNRKRGSFHGNYGGYYGNEDYNFSQNYGSYDQMNLATRPNLQGKDKLHWVRGKQDKFHWVRGQQHRHESESDGRLS